METAKVRPLGLIQHRLFLEHRISQRHPENPGRLETIPSLTASVPVLEIPLRPLVETEFTRVHAGSLWKELQAIAGKEGWIDPDTYHGPRSWEVALTAAGTVVDLALRIYRGQIARGLALVRPPGHHATPGAAMGFCLMNHVALAATAVLSDRPQARVAIVDFDLHHGNGTQDAFFGDDRVLFASSHRYPFYPGTGALTEIGTGRGKGTTFNFPISSADRGDAFFVGLYGQLICPLLKQFRPDIILVSAGFDGHRDDPMHGFRITSPAYGDLARLLMRSADELCGGKILFCLEGGYRPQALAESVAEVWRAMQEPEIAPVAMPGESFAEWDQFQQTFSLQ